MKNFPLNYSRVSSKGITKPIMEKDTRLIQNSIQKLWYITFILYEKVMKTIVHLLAVSWFHVETIESTSCFYYRYKTVHAV